MPDDAITTPTADTAPADTPPAPEAKEIAALPEWAQKLVKDLRSESASHRTKAKTAEDQLEAARLKELSDLDAEKERTKKLSEENATLKERTQKANVQLRAHTKNAVDPDAVYALLPKDNVNWDDDAAVDAAIDALLASKPYLVKSTKATVTTTPLSPETGKLTYEALSKMTREQIASLPQDEVARALASKS